MGKQALKRQRWEVLAGLIHERDLKVGVELGVRDGSNMAGVLGRCPHFNWIGVDLWEKVAPEKKQDWFKVFRERYDALVEAWPDEQIQTLEMYTATAAEEFEDRSVDLVFIDADRSYEGVLRDIEAWLPKVRQGGVISGHDYGNYSGVTGAVDKVFRSRVNEEDDYVWWVAVE